jgi:hypothetical protein
MIFEPNQLKAFAEKLIRCENHHHLSMGLVNLKNWWADIFFDVFF